MPAEAWMQLQAVPPVLDDAGLVALLKLPDGENLAYYRQKAGLPYVPFKSQGRITHRYVTSEVMEWLRVRQNNPFPEDDAS